MAPPGPGQKGVLRPAALKDEIYMFTAWLGRWGWGEVGSVFLGQSEDN